MKYLVLRAGCDDAKFHGPDAAGAARQHALRVKAEGAAGAIVCESPTGFQTTMDSWDHRIQVH